MLVLDSLSSCRVYFWAFFNFCSTRKVGTIQASPGEMFEILSQKDRKFAAKIGYDFRDCQTNGFFTVKLIYLNSDYLGKAIACKIYVQSTSLVKLEEPP